MLTMLYSRWIEFMVQEPRSGISGHEDVQHHSQRSICGGFYLIFIIVGYSGWDVCCRKGDAFISKSPNAIEFSHFGSLYCESYQLEEKQKYIPARNNWPWSSRGERSIVQLWGQERMFETSVIYWYGSWSTLT